jgi:hypothetical protein
MKGFSLSLLRLNETFEKAINADVQTVGWQKPVPFAPMKTHATTRFTTNWKSNRRKTHR